MNKKIRDIAELLCICIAAFAVCMIVFFLISGRPKGKKTETEKIAQEEVFASFTGLRYLNLSDSNPLEDAYKFKQEYEQYNDELVTEESDIRYQALDLPVYAGLRYSDTTQIDSISDGLIYFGYPTCPYCRNSVPLLLELAQEKSCMVYYVNSKGWSDLYELQDGVPVLTREAGEGYYDFLEKCDEYLQDYTLTDKDGNKIPVNEKRLFVPFVVRVEDGEIVSAWSSGNVEFTENPTNPHDRWTDEQQAEAYANMCELLFG